MKVDYTRYIISLIITIAIFSTTFYIASYFANRKVSSVNSIQQSIAVDILSNEVQFLFKESTCDDAGSVNNQISEIGDRLSFTEQEIGGDDERVVYLKKYYSLLEIKDYLLGKKTADKCGAAKKPIYMIYMYSNKVDCEDCSKQSIVLGRLREMYPELRVYTFDYDLPLGPLDTMKKIYKIKPQFPVLVVEDKAYYGFQDVETLSSLLPEALKEATTTSLNASSTSIIRVKN